MKAMVGGLKRHYLNHADPKTRKERAKKDE
jgi:hypothetical protein